MKIFKQIIVKAMGLIPYRCLGSPRSTNVPKPPEGHSYHKRSERGQQHSN